MSSHPLTVNTNFNSIQEFQAYFQNHDDLVVPANQPLEIKNISILTRMEEDPFEAKEILPQEISQLALYILCKMVMPLAKTAGIKFDNKKGNQLDVRINEHFVLSCSNGMTLKTQKNNLYLRLTDLFKLMIAFSISKVEFAPNQELIALGITEGESILEKTVQANFDKIFQPRIPAGFKASMVSKEKNQDFHVSNGWATYGEPIPQRSFTIRSSQSWSLILDESKNFLFSIDGFRRRMKIKDEWEIPANQVLRIEDEAFARLQEEYTQAQFAGRDFGEFALNQILLPLGKTVRFIEHGAHGHDLRWSNDFLEISSPDGFTLKTGFGDLFIKLTHLGQLLIENHLSSLVLQPQQRLFIYGLNEKQKTELKEWVTSKDQAIMLDKLKSIFMQFNPLGFVWDLKWKNDIYMAAATFKAQKLPESLLISSSNHIEIELNRASGEWLALNLINNSSSELLQAILDADEKALIYILFKAIFYHCCDDFRHFRTDEFPEFFKKTTQDNLTDLLKNNANFIESLRLVMKNLETQQQLSKILRSSPDKFSQLDLKELPDPLKTLMKTMMKLVYEELQGSPFIAQCVRNITQGLENGSLKSFIRSSSLEATNPIQTASENQIAMTSETEISTNNHPETNPIPATPAPSMISKFLSFILSSVTSSISRFIAWLFRR